MDNFQSGFASELVAIFGKEAAAEQTLSKAEKLKAAAATPEGRKLIAHARRGGRSVAIGTLAHKLINPDSTTVSSVRSGVGMAAGGAIGANLVRQLGFKGGRGAIAGSFLGSALGIRAMRKGKKPKKSDRELLAMALKKESQQMVATATIPKQDAMSGATSTPRPSARPNPGKILTDASGARGTAAQLAENKAAGLRAKKRSDFQSGIKGIAGKIQGAAKSWSKKWSGGGESAKSPVKQMAPTTRVQPSTPAPQSKTESIRQALTQQGGGRHRFKSFMP